MTYFRLNTFCRLVTNNEEGCLYDLSTGRMWELDSENVGLLVEAEKNINIERNSFFDELCEQQLGCYYEKPIWIDHSCFGADETTQSIINNKPYLETMYIVFDRCSYNCDFCSPNLNRKTGCKKHNINKTINYKMLIEAVDNALNLGCQEIIYIGGDPLIYKDLLQKMIVFCNTKVQKQEVYTNGSLLDRYWLEFFQKNNVKINYQVVNQYISSDIGDNNNLENHIKKIKSYNIELNLTILANNINQYELEKYINTSSKVEVAYCIDTVIEPANYRPKDWEEILGKGKSFKMPINQYTYAMLQTKNSCLYGKVAIKLDGTIIPCPMMDDYVIDNIRHTNIITALRSNIYKDIIYSTKNNQDKCKICVYRFGCSDCRAVEYNLTKDHKTNELCCR